MIFHKAQLAAAPYHCVAYGSYEELLDNEDIELVYIPLPTGLHYEWIHKALEKGKHVMSEKSLSCTYDEVRELVELACDKHLLLIENFQFRFHSQHVWVKELLERLELGVSVVSAVPSASPLLRIGIISAIRNLLAAGLCLMRELIP